MRIESALLCAKEGITAHGNAISVVGDNIANSNTTGYKASRTEFSDMLSEGNGGASESSTPCGDGVSVGTVRQIFDEGLVESTGRDLDTAIDGGGFFTVGTATDPMFTRAGNFELDNSGYLVTSGGYQVLGTSPGSAALGPINLYKLDTAGSATTAAQMVANVDASSEVRTPPATPLSFNDLAKVANFMGTTSSFDSLGKAHTINVFFFKSGQNAWTSQAYIDGADVGSPAGTPVKIGETNLTFGQNGVMTDAAKATAKIDATPAYSGGAASGKFSIDLSLLTQYASQSSLSGVSQDGKGAGNVSGYEIRNDGSIYANLDSGSSQLVGTIQLASFRNEDGLDRAGQALYRAGESAGTMTTGAAGTGAFGTIKGGALERSTVDITNEFVNLMLYQRGYQANSQTMTTANEIIKETIALM